MRWTLWMLVLGCSGGATDEDDGADTDAVANTNVDSELCEGLEGDWFDTWRLADTGYGGCYTALNLCPGGRGYYEICDSEPFAESFSWACSGGQVTLSGSITSEGSYDADAQTLELRGMGGFHRVGDPSCP